MTVNRIFKFIIAFLFSAISFPLQFVSAVIFLLLILPLGFLGLYKAARPLLRLFSIYSLFLAGKILHIYGRDRIDRSKSYLFVINHSSYYDVVGVCSFAPVAAWLGKEPFDVIPLFATLSKLINYIRVYPGDRERSRKAIEVAIAKGKNLSVIIFPEGTRTPHGKMTPFRKGFVHILRGTGLDILPVTLNGFYRMMPRHRFLINPFARIEAHIHAPIPAAQLIGKTDEEIIDQVYSVISSEYTDQTDF